jgi:hypothetical protein
MHNYTISNEVLPWLRIHRPEAGDNLGWNLRIDGGDGDSIHVPVDKALQAAIKEADLALFLASASDSLTACGALAKPVGFFRKYTHAQLVAAVQQVSPGWRLDGLVIGTDGLLHYDRHSPGETWEASVPREYKNPCLVHVAVPDCSGYKAATYYNVTVDGRKGTAYHDIDSVCGLTSYQGCSGSEQLFYLEEGTEFIITRSRGEWLEARFLWTGKELQRFPLWGYARRQARRARQEQLRA